MPVHQCPLDRCAPRPWVMAILMGWIAIGVVAASQVAGADEPVATYIFPAGGQRGTTVDVRVGGLYLHSMAHMEVLGPSIQCREQIPRMETIWFDGPVIPLPDSQQAEDYPQDHAGSINIASDAALGMRHWRLWTSQGATGAKLFVVGDLPEVVEQEMDGEPVPVSVQLPVTINGRTFPREDVDLWSFEAQAGSTIWGQVQALSLGSPVQAHLEILDAQGARLAESTARGKLDPTISFVVPTTGTYQVRIHDANFGGLQHHVYRLTLVNGPRVDNVYPLGGRRGSQVSLSLFGVGLSVDHLDLPIPVDASEAWLANVNLAGTFSQHLLVETDTLNEVLENEPNNVPEQSTSVTGPVVLNGRIDQPGDVDLWRISAKQGEVWDLDLRAARLGSLLDSMLVVTDATNKELARSDDLAADQSDSQLRFTANADGEYTLAISDRFDTRGGNDFAYRLKISPAPPADYALVLAADALTAYRGAPAKLKVDVRRTGDFTGPIQLEIQGLPEGVVVTGNEIPANAAATELVFSADATAKIQAAHLSIQGTAEIGGQKVSRLAATLAPRGQNAVDQVLLAVALPTPFKVTGKYAVTYAPQGSQLARHYLIDRGTYSGTFEVRMADHQMRHLQGVRGPVVHVPAEASECDYSVYLPPWMELGRTSRACIMAVGVIQDADGSQHEVSFTSVAQNEQIVSILSPGLISVHADRASLGAAPNSTAELSVHVARDSSLRQPVQVELIVPEPMHGISAAPVTLSADEEQCNLQIQFGPELSALNMPVTVRVQLQNGDQTYIGECRLQLVPSSSVSGQ